MATERGKHVLTEPGGTTGETVRLIEHAPSFVLGEGVLIFTERSPDGRLIVLGLTQGKVTLKNDQSIVMRSAPTGTITYTKDAHGTMVGIRKLMVEHAYTPIVNCGTAEPPGDGMARTRAKPTSFGFTPEIGNHSGHPVPTAQEDRNRRGGS
jgi:hypothetical protein